MNFILLLLLLVGRKIAQIGQTESLSRTRILQDYFYNLTKRLYYALRLPCVLCAFCYSPFFLFRDSFSYNDIFFFGFFTFSFFEKIHNLF